MYVRASGCVAVWVRERESVCACEQLLIHHSSPCQDGPEGRLVNPECVVERVNSSRFELLLKVENTGHYVGSVLYKVWARDGTSIPPHSQISIAADIFSASVFFRIRR